MLAQGAMPHLLLRSRPLPSSMDTCLIHGVWENLCDLKKYSLGLRKGEGPVSENPRVYPLHDVNEDELEYSYLRNRKCLGDWAMQIHEWYTNGILVSVGCVYMIQGIPQGS